MDSLKTMNADILRAQMERLQPTIDRVNAVVGERERAEAAFAVQDQCELYNAIKAELKERGDVGGVQPEACGLSGPPEPQVVKRKRGRPRKYT